MSVQIDNTYRTQRLRLTSTVVAAAARLWDTTYRERDQAIAAVIPLVHAGQRQTVRLTEAYMSAKAADAREPVRRLNLPPELYTIAVLRGLPAEEVYGRPFGALGAHLERGDDFAVAAAAARASLGRLVATDMQLAQTHAARDVMTASERIVGYRRVLGPGRNCPLCVSASSRTYSKADLAPIHERCGCSVAPLFAGADGIFTANGTETYYHGTGDGGVPLTIGQSEWDEQFFLTSDLKTAERYADRHLNSRVEQWRLSPGARIWKPEGIDPIDYTPTRLVELIREAKKKGVDAVELPQIGTVVLKRDVAVKGAVKPLEGVKVVEDPEIGPRLVADTWTETGPLLEVAA